MCLPFIQLPNVQIYWKDYAHYPITNKEAILKSRVKVTVEENIKNRSGHITSLPLRVG